MTPIEENLVFATFVQNDFILGVRTEMAMLKSSGLFSDVKRD